MPQAHLAGKSYKYRVGKHNVVITFPTSEKIIVPFDELLNTPWDALQHDIEKHTLAIRPRDVKNYLQPFVDTNSDKTA